MKIKNNITTIGLLLLEVIGLIVNSALLFVILVYDTFLLTDFITVSAVVLLTLAIIGISFKQKWGSGLALVKSMIDFILLLIFLSQGIIGTTIIIALTTILAFNEYQKSTVPTIKTQQHISI